MENGAWYGMDDSDVRRRQNPYRGSRYESRRPLKTYNLHPPDYHIDTDVLLHEYVEFEVRFAGSITGVPGDVDVTNRTEVLKIIDRGKKNNKIPKHVSYDHDAILSLSKSNIKLSLRSMGERLIMRVPIHEIAAICYIKDDGVHTLSIKHGNPEECSLAVLYCDSQMTAEGICSLVGQCFQLVYTDATIQLLEETIEIAKEEVSIKSNSTGSPTIPVPDSSRRISFGSLDDGFSKSQPDLPTSVPVQKSPRSHSVTNSEVSVHSSQAELVKAYLAELSTKFSVEELSQFASSLKALHDSAAQPFQEFCDSVYKLYGPERKHMLVGLCPFIPEKNYPFFADFLKKNGIKIPENGHGTLSSRHSFPRIYTRSISDISNDQSDSELDCVLDNISTQLAQIDLNIGDVRPYIY